MRLLRRCISFSSLAVAVALPGCGDDELVDPSAVAFPVPLEATASRSAILAGDTLTLTATVAEAVANPSVRWLLAPRGLPLAEGLQATVRLPDTGTVTIVAVGTAPGLSPGFDTVTVLVEVNRRPAVTALSVPAAGYVGDTVLLIATAADPDSSAISVTWFSNILGRIGTGDTLRWVPSSAAIGVHLITASVRDAAGAGADQSDTVRLLPTDRFRWTRMYGEPGHGTTNALLALADEGQLYAAFYLATSCSSCFSAIDGRTGAVRWTRQLESALWDHSSGLTVAPDGRVFLFDFTGVGKAFDANGTELWRTQVLGGDPHGRWALSPEGALYAAGRSTGGPLGSGGWLVRVDPASGIVQWRIDRGGQYRHGPTILPDRRVVTGFATHQLVSADGTVLADTTLPVTGHYMAAADAAGNVYAGRGPRLWKVAGDGRTEWMVSFPAGRPAEPVVDAAGNVFTSAAGLVRSIAPDGTVRWEQTIDGVSWIARLALLADGSVLVAEGRFLVRFDQATGAPLDTVEFAADIEAGLAVGPDNTVYVVTGDARLTALEGWAPLDPTAPWAIWRRDNRRTASVPR